MTAILTLFVLGVGYCLFVVIHSHSVADIGREMGVCVNAMRALDAAKEQWAMAARATNGTAMRAEDTLPYLRDHKMPVCPSGGDYIVGTVGKPPACTVHGDMEHYHRPGKAVPWP